MQIKTSVKMPLYTRMPKMEMINNNNYWGSEVSGTPINYWWDCKLIQSLWESVWQYLLKLNICGLYDLVNLLLDVYSIYIIMFSKDTSKNVHSLIVIITPQLKQPKFLSIVKCINKLWCIHLVKYYTAVRMTELQLHTRTWWILKTRC